MSNTKTKPRNYTRMTPAKVAEFKAREATLGNGSAAVRDLTPHISNVGDRAFKLRKKAEQESAEDYLDDALKQIAVAGVKRIGELVLSTNERIASQNAQYAVDHVRGTAVRRSESKNVTLSIEAVLGE